MVYDFKGLDVVKYPIGVRRSGTKFTTLYLLSSSCAGLTTFSLKTTLETSGEVVKTTLETSGEDV